LPAVPTRLPILLQKHRAAEVPVACLCARPGCALAPGAGKRDSGYSGQCGASRG